MTYKELIFHWYFAVKHNQAIEIIKFFITLHRFTAAQAA
jgi:hypothetical protein